ncbi:nucleotidyl transferase AbiEii/AbiGii toxin family protein [Cellulomonas sp.]|uniref:nucleotidyl transferase AbiEii/AbiGii toxin family protein n=1 Tax=Cellulomonas sp. TaxID=40001 RepID=UPI003BAABE84
MTGPSLDEWERVGREFGVEIEQVRRDHLVSHVLAALAAGVSTDDLVFFGGTALSRTHLADSRLSEDIDLLALGPRSGLARELEVAVRRGLARSHGYPTWTPPLPSTRGSQPSVLSAPGGASIQVQLLDGVGHRWPTEIVDVQQRYADAPPARLRVPTAPGFAAAKLSAWIDRRAPRDLYDLWALAERGLIDDGARDVLFQHGPFGRPAPAWAFDRGVDEDVWRRSLGHQTTLRVTASAALAAVRAAWLAD